MTATLVMNCTSMTSPSDVDSTGPVDSRFLLRQRRVELRDRLVGRCSCRTRCRPITLLRGPLPLVQYRQRVAPPGATVASAVAVCGVRRYTNHGGGPAEGALNSAVRALPVSSTRAGHPSAAQRAAIAATVDGSVIWQAVPSRTRSKSWVATLSAQRGLRARFLALRVCPPVSNQKA